MIPFDFAYYKPESVQEAVETFQELSSQGKQPVYYSGGTEIITLGRVNKLFTQAVIDIKGIPECHALYTENNQLIMGAALSLTQVAESNLFPLLTESGGRIADHTSRGKITLGGNICGQFMYREAVLPFLVADSEVVIAGSSGTRVVSINQVFNGSLQLSPGELLIQIKTDNDWRRLPHRGIKKTRLDRIGYPLISLAVIKKAGKIYLAISGLCYFPFRSGQIERALNDNSCSLETKIENVMKQLPGPIVDDVEGSADYRKFVLANTLQDVLMEFD